MSDLQISFLIFLLLNFISGSLSRSVSKLVAKRSVTSSFFRVKMFSAKDLNALVRFVQVCVTQVQLETTVPVCSFAQSEVSVQPGCPASVIYV